MAKSTRVERSIIIEKTERSDTTNLHSSIFNIQFRLVRVGSYTTVIKPGDNATHQRFIDPVFGFLPEQCIDSALDGLTLITVQPSVPVVYRIPGAENQIFAGTIDTP